MAKFLNRQIWCHCDPLQKPVQFARQSQMAITAKRHGFDTTNLAEKLARRTAVATEIPNREAASRHFTSSSTATNTRRRKSSEYGRVHAGLYSSQHDLLPNLGLVYKESLFKCYSMACSCCTGQSLPAQALTIGTMSIDLCQ
jgi:hypothetical protein